MNVILFNVDSKSATDSKYYFLYGGCISNIPVDKACNNIKIRKKQKGGSSYDGLE